MKRIDAIENAIGIISELAKTGNDIGEETISVLSAMRDEYIKRRKYNKKYAERKANGEK